MKPEQIFLKSNVGGNKELEKKKSGGLRLPTLRLICLGVFLVLGGNLFRTQIFQGSYFRELADGNRAREIPILAQRGTIYDRNGQELVINLPTFRLGETPISKEQAIELETKQATTSNSLVVDSVRSYLFGESAAHLLGYVSQVSEEEIKENSQLLPGEKMGRGGVEEEQDGRLRGKDGKELVEVDARGKKLRTLSTIPATAGENLTLSIDADLQKTAYEQIRGKKAAVVISDPRNGQILGLVSSPSYDPNVFTGLSLGNEEKISELLTDFSQPLFNRAIAGTYPSGSTFKIVTAAAGLESGKLSEQTAIDDPGILVIGPYKFPNWKYLQDGGTQGVLNVVGALQKSNDIFFYKTGEWVGVDTLADFALRFGLYQKSGIDLPGEVRGLVPTKEWREKNARSWYLGDTYHLAIGQGDLLVTPLQVNRWTSVIASGGKLCTPHVLLIPDSQCRDIGLSRKTVDLIKEGMVAACTPGGTAYPLFNFQAGGKPIQIACKTGSAEFGDGPDKLHSWLTAYAPADPSAGGPRIAVTVLVEAAGEGSDIAAPVVKKILEQYFENGH